MKQPTEDDFKDHAFAVNLKTLHQTSLERTAFSIKFGYQLALYHATNEVEAAVKDLKQFRTRSNLPQ